MDIKNKYDKDIYKVVAKNVRKYLDIKKMSIKELSAYAGINEYDLEKFLNFEGNTISIYDLYKIGIILDVSIRNFFQNK